MENIFEKFQGVLQEHIPAMAAQEMKVFVETAQKSEEKLKAAEYLIEKMKENEKYLNKKIYDLQGIAETMDSLNKRENSVAAKERELELEKLKFEVTKQMSELKAVEAEKRVDVVFGLTSLMFKNESVTKSIFENRMKSIPGTPANNHYGSTETEIINTVVKEEKEKN